MPETLPLESPNAPQPRSLRAPLAVMATAIVLFGAAYIYFTEHDDQKRVTAPGPPRLAFGPAEQVYSSSIHIENVTLARAENFLHQEVITLSGEIINEGSRSISQLEVSIEFFDDANQIALRETHYVYELAGSPLTPGQHRAFEVSFEHIPSIWNRQQPVVQVTGMRFIP